MAHYKIEIWDPVRPCWRSINTSWTGNWDVTYAFDSIDDAVEGLEEWFEAYPAMRTRKYRIIDTSGVVQAAHHGGGWDYNPAERGATRMPEIELEKPLKLKRTSVIAKLQDNFKKERDEREEAEQKEKDARADFQQFVSDHEEQIVNYLRSALYSSSASWKTVLETAEETFKDDAFKTAESKPGRLESELEKLVRVLEMGTEDTIEVKPTQRVYDLL